VFAFDSVLASGLVGVRSSSSATLASFATAPISEPTNQSTPFPDSFDANPPTQQLSSNWLEHDGNYDVTTGDAVGKAATNLATVLGISTADADLTADLDLASVGQFASLVARYSGPGETHMYIAQIQRTATGYTVSILKNLGGANISIRHMTTTTFGGGLRFKLVGTQLEVYLDGAASPVLSLTDKSITAAGAVGIRSSAGATINDFASN
jgi:hypothetical protein